LKLLESLADFLQKFKKPTLTTEDAIMTITTPITIILPLPAEVTTIDQALHALSLRVKIFEMLDEITGELPGEISNSINALCRRNSSAPYHLPESNTLIRIKEIRNPFLYQVSIIIHYNIDELLAVLERFSIRHLVNKPKENGEPPFPIIFLYANEENSL
jgi:hypothetical protein